MPADHSPQAASATAPTAPWLLSARADLAWIHGSVLVAYALFACWYLGILTVPTIFVIWVFACHGPHFWATWSRTYIDRNQANSRRNLLRGSLLWFAVGPLVVGAGLVLRRETDRPELIQAFFFAAALWAFHHVVKQHFGFLALYRIRQGNFDRAGLHRWKLWLVAVLWLPALALIVGNDNFLKQVPGVFSWLLEDPEANLPALRRIQHLVCSGADLLTILLLCGLLVWVLTRARRAFRRNLPMLLLLACCVPLNCVVLYVCRNPQLPGSYTVLVPILTIYHNLQYHGLVQHYHRRRYQGPDRDPQAGWALRLNRSFLSYALCGLAFTALTVGFEYYGIASIQGSGSVALLAQAFFWGFAFHHYYLDSKIWKVSRDQDLQVVLGLTRP